MSYQVNHKFRVGQRVRVEHDRLYFHHSVRNVDMTVLEIITEDVDGTPYVFYRCDRVDPIHGNFNEFELVGVEEQPAGMIERV